MLLTLEVGALHEPLTGRHWDPPEIQRQVAARIGFYHARGVARGDRIFLLFGNRLEFFADLLAIWRLGGCPVPVDARLTRFEIETLAKAARPRFLVLRDAANDAVGDLGVPALDSSEAGEADVAAPRLASRFAPDDDALILFTSGSTGDPKGVVHTHRSLAARWVTLRQSLGLEAYRRTLCLLPTHFGHGLICNCLFPWLHGQDLFVLPPFSPDVVMRLGALLDEHEITFLSSVPSVWRLALRARRPPRGRTLERIFCGSAPLSAHLWREIQDWSGARQVCNAYGITETGSWVAGTTVPDVEPEDGLIGVPWGAAVRVLRQGTTATPPSLAEACAPGETGHVWLHTPALMRGYLDRDDLTARAVAEGWFVTGDIGLVDDRGLLYLRGRERDEINKGGTKVYPSDVDAVAERFPAVTDVCCFPVEDDLYGQNVGLAVVLADDRDETLRALHAWLGEHLATYQLPVRWYRVEAIPRTSRGKINRAGVAQTCAGLDPLDLRRVLGGGD
jgi:acyl-CoA synthetase (AMP-forming)/AMP-acid ligase II